MDKTYFILITSIEEHKDKFDNILNKLTDQINKYMINGDKIIKIFVCNDNIEKHLKKELLLKETNYSPNHVFLDVLDDINITYVIDFVNNNIITLDIIPKKNAVVTACNSKYFKGCLTLITSLRKHSDKDVDVIYVFDLGLTEDEQRFLLNLEKVEFIPMIEILQYTREIRETFTDFLTPNQFAWKSWFIRFIFEHSDIENVFWIDSGIMSFGNIGFIFKHIEKHGVWLTEDEGWTNYNFTHDICKNIMKATDKELEGNQLIAGLSGFNKKLGLFLLHQWCEFCRVKEAVTGIHWFEEPYHYTDLEKNLHYTLHGHRHDQSILSILRIRYSIPTVQKTWEFYEFRSLEHAKQNNSLFYNHHGSYEDIQL